MTYAIILNAMSGRFRQDHITLVVWYYNTAANNSIMFAMCYRENGMALFRRHWNSSATSLHARSTCSLLQATHNLKMDVDPKVPKRHNKFAVDAAIICSCFSLLNTASFGYLAFGFGISPASSFGLCGPWYSELFCGINMISPFFGSVACVLPVALYSLICRSISAQFTNLSEEFDQVVNSPRPMDKTILNCFRRRHAIVCHTVEVADDVFSLFAAVMYLANVPCGIFLLYQLFYLGSEWFYVGLTLFWLFCYFGNVSVLSYFAVQVHEKAHSLRRRVHELQMDTFDSDLSQVQILFLARLNGPEIGMTALGCFVITKERVLAVMSTLITFFTILLQFQGLSPSDDVTMATTNISMTTGVYTT
ncbi:uncharacterized protein LOC115920745 [Strongylocentrotus purpuratus]|uniref:Gustatory receptor n=1 Tax=Strongylocentrotus purpuratus TaxID=7668 RepID=A0A7M7SUW2_STRPU|nr:uncharacterized protein LOC115920745 [Strongylocentrotus purpuratus]